MDAREMKKQILYYALDAFSQMSFDNTRLRETVSIIVEKNPDKISQAQINRFVNVLTKMLDDAESKI